MRDALYLILRHRDDKTRKYRRAQYRNHWIDDERVKSISTTPHVANECRKEREKQEIVYVHRCGWKPKGKPTIPPTISGSVRVREIDGSPKHPVVHFAQVKSLKPRRATAKQRQLAKSHRGSNCYRHSAPRIRP